jgi:hypothetical protein
VGHHAAVSYTATTALPHLERAAAGLRAEPRHVLLDAGVAAAPDWATLAVEGPDEVTDGLGRVWFTYRARLELSASNDSAKPLRPT